MCGWLDGWGENFAYFAKIAGKKAIGEKGKKGEKEAFP